MAEKQTSNNKHPLEFTVIVLLVLGVVWFVWGYTLQPSRQSNNSPTKQTQNIEVQDRLNELNETDERRKAIRQQLTQSRDTSQLFTYQGEIIDIQRDRLITTPHSLPADLIDFPALFPKQVTINLNSSTLYQSVSPIDRERANEILTEYKKKISLLPPGTDVSQYPPYPDSVSDIRPLAFFDLVKGDIISVLSNKPIVGEDTIVANIITIK